MLLHLVSFSFAADCLCVKVFLKIVWQTETHNHRTCGFRYSQLPAFLYFSVVAWFNIVFVIECIQSFLLLLLLLASSSVFAVQSCLQQKGLWNVVRVVIVFVVAIAFVCILVLRLQQKSFCRTETNLIFLFFLFL